MMFEETKEKVCMEVLKGGHQLVRLELLGEVSQEKSVMYIKLNDVGSNKRDVER